MRYHNPILPGFYPDPSVCRVGRDYYLVTSTFEYFPGVPLFHSRNLIEWEQIGHVLTRPSQLSLGNCRASEGIWAPTIRYHSGRFYMSTTNYNNGGNFYVWTDDIHGPWSEPIWVAQGGIDPSIFFDDDGAAYFASTFDEPGAQTIGQCAIDILTGEMLTPTKRIWTGSGGKYPEGPHMLRRGGWYYLLIAEGGTEYGHMVTIARSRSPWGPFEGNPNNPVLTHRDTTLDHFQAIGHGDLVDTPEGETWMVFHGIRTSQYMLHHLGRETMIAPVAWDGEGWPVVNGGRLIAPEMEIPGDERAIYAPVTDFYENFDRETLSPRWCYLRNPDPACYHMDPRNRRFGIAPNAWTLDDLASPGFIGCRQRDFSMRAQVRVQAEPADRGDFSGITVFHTNENHYDLGVTLRDGVRVCVLRKHVGDMIVECEPVPTDDGPVFMRVESDRLKYRFYAGSDETSMRFIGEGRTQLLSTEVIPMTFTGCFIALFAQGSQTAWFSDFSYRGTRDV